MKKGTAFKVILLLAALMLLTASIGMAAPHSGVSHHTGSHNYGPHYTHYYHQPVWHGWSGYWGNWWPWGSWWSWRYW